jgi:hypothetical protein
MKKLAYPKPVLQKKVFFILAFIALTFLGGYAYFVNKTVWNVVSRQNAVKELSKMSSQVAELEASFMSLSGSLTLDQAYVLGFHEVTSADTTFIERAVPAVAIR